MSTGTKGRQKGQKLEGTIVERMAKKIDSASFVKSYKERVNKWVAAEKDQVRKENLQEMVLVLEEIETRRAEVAQSLVNLIESNYAPPKVTSVSSLPNYEPGKQVWIKSTKLESYSKLYNKAQLSSFYVDQVVDARVAIKLNNSGAAFFIPKLHLTTVKPELSK